MLRSKLAYVKDNKNIASKFIFIKIIQSMFFSLFLPIGFVSIELKAGGLASPFEVESTAVLPTSIRNPRYKNINTWVDEKFNSLGKRESLGGKLNQNIIWDNLISKQSSDDQKNLLKGTLESQSITDQDTVGSITGAVSAYANVNVPVFAYGIKENWTIALAVPIYKIELNVDSGFVLDARTQLFINKLEKNDPVKASEVSQNLNHPLQTELQNKGYKPLQSEKYTAIGDIKLVSKYQFFRSDDDTIAFKSELTLPTGTTSDPDKLVELPTGDGQYDLGLGLIWDHQLTSKFSWNFYGNINIQLPDHLKRRIPKSPEGGLTSDVEDVFRDSGDQYLLGTSIQFGRSQGGFYSNLGYIYQYMQRTRFSGTRFSNDRYRWLEDQNPSQLLNSLVGQIGYSTIESFQSKDFPIPLQANIGFGHPLSGRNATAADVYMAELVLFF